MAPIEDGQQSLAAPPYQNAADLANDPFLSHSKFKTPMGPPVREEKVNEDPFMTHTAEVRNFRERPEHLYPVDADPFLTRSKPAPTAVQSSPQQRKKSQYTLGGLHAAAPKHPSKTKAKLLYRFYDLKYRNEDPAEMIHLFLRYLQDHGVPGLILTQLHVEVKPGSVIVEVVGDEESLRLVRQKCPSVYIKGCEGALVDADRPDLQLHEDAYGNLVRDQEKIEAVPEPVYPYWYRADNNWIECWWDMSMQFSRIRQTCTGQWFEKQQLAQITAAEKAQQWLHSRTDGRMGKLYQPHMEHVRFRDDYKDPSFRPHDASWFAGGEPSPVTVLPRVARWNRLLEYSADCPYPMVDFAAGGLQPRGGRIYQGSPENFYLIAALQAISMKPQLIANIFCNMEFSDPRLGCYILRFYKHGQWQFVDIDDSIPCLDDFSPLTCQSEFWPSFPWATLIEKAYAKLHGCYENLGGGGHVTEVLTDLTGGCATRYGTRDVANDRLWMYLYEMQKQCIFACNINEAECSKRSIPIEKHWASAIWRVAKHEDFLYVCVCTAAPYLTCVHMPACMVPSLDGYGVNEGFVWLRIDDFVQLFDTIYECRLVNSDLGPPQLTGIGCSPGWIPNWFPNKMPWFEDLFAFQGNVTSESAPCFIIDVPVAPNEITLEISQTDLRYRKADEISQTREEVGKISVRRDGGYDSEAEVSAICMDDPECKGFVLHTSGRYYLLDPGEDELKSEVTAGVFIKQSAPLLFDREVQAPLLLRFYECSREVSEVTGGEIYLVHLSAWGHTRDACTGVKVTKPGRYMATVSIPAKYTCHKMIFRTYSLFPINITPVTNHRSFVAVTPARPLGAFPYCMCGFMRVHSARDSLPQLFDEAEGRGKPMANPMYEGWTTGSDSHWGALRRGRLGPLRFLWPYPFPTPCELLGCGSPRGFLGTGLFRGYGRLNGMMPQIAGVGGGLPMLGYGLMGRQRVGEVYEMGDVKDGEKEYEGMKVVGKFGGKHATATVEANEDPNCTVM